MPSEQLVRIPLVIEATATGMRAPGVLVAVMVTDLDRLEARLAAAEAMLAGKPWARRRIERAYSGRG